MESAFARLLEFEQRRDLLSLQLGDTAVWPVLRTAVFRLLTWAPDAGEPVPRGALRRLILRDLLRLPWLGRTDILAKTVVSGLLEADNGRYRDVWLDDLLEGRSAIKLMAPNHGGLLRRARRAAVPAQLSGALFDRIAYARARHVPSAELLSVARAFGSILREETGCAWLTDDWVALRLRGFDAQTGVYRRFLARVRPRVVIVADAGEYVLCVAARGLGIPVVEIQHGAIDRAHPSYIWPAAARSRRAHMPLPDRILLWGDFWRAELARAGFWRDELRVVGSARLDRYRARRDSRARPERLEILFTDQAIEPAAAAAFLAESLRALPAHASVHLWIKLHPVFGSNRSAYDEAFGGDARVTILSAGEEPSTLDLLSRVDAHVSISSTAHYEALALGVPTFGLPFQRAADVGHLWEEGDAAIAADPANLAALAVSARSVYVPAAVRDRYFVPDARARIERELADLGIS